jgi:hypothetical protein
MAAHSGLDELVREGPAPRFWVQVRDANCLLHRITETERQTIELRAEVARLQTLVGFGASAATILSQLITWCDESDVASDYCSTSPLGDIIDQARQWEIAYRRHRESEQKGGE